MVSSKSTFSGDPLAYCGRRITQAHHAFLLEKFPDIREKINRQPDGRDPLDIHNDDLRGSCQSTGPAVGILGAGISGLYAALILDSLEIRYEILEASDRTGGRLSTYRFPNGGTYDYYEEGAMRFPLPGKDNRGKYKNGFMARLADLIEYEPLNQGSDKLRDKLIPYYFNARDGSAPGFYYFNGIYQPVEKNTPKLSFGAEHMGVGDAYIKAGSKAIHEDVISPFVTMMAKDYKAGRNDHWRVMEENESYSVRAYMASKYMPSAALNLPPQHLSEEVINWCNLLEGSSGGYDRALTEAIFSTFAFAKVDDRDNNFGDVHWKCFKGGSETLPKKIEEYLNSKGSSVQFHQRVTAIRLTTSGSRRDVEVEVNGSTTKKYPHVISTLPLTVLRAVDLKDAGLSVLQRNALRALDYGPSIKIAIRFRSNWWTTKLGIVGGQSFTDLPIRTIVYPSYGVDSDPPSKVLIAGYTWTTDASRLSALALQREKLKLRHSLQGEILGLRFSLEKEKNIIRLSLEEKLQGHPALQEILKDHLSRDKLIRDGLALQEEVNAHSAPQKDTLKDLVLRNLAEAHSKVNAEITYDYLVGEYVDMHVKDWNSDEYAMGAMPYFSPGEFGKLYTELNVPAGEGRLHIAGEAVSTRHGWVVGALDSAWKAVWEYLKVTGQTEKVKELENKWGKNWEWASDSTLAAEREKHDLLDEHFGVITAAIQLQREEAKTE